MLDVYAIASEVALSTGAQFSTTRDAVRAQLGGHAPDTAGTNKADRRAAPAVFYAKARRALRIARGYDGDTRDAIIRVARRWRALARAARKSVMQKGNAS